MPENSVISEQNLFGYLIDKLEEELDKTAISIEDDTVWYLGNLLTRFAERQHFFIQEREADVIPTLAFLYRDAREATSASNRHNLLRKLGDSAVFMGAWFARLYRKKGIGRDYFVGMGHAAYDYLADNAYEQRHTYVELAQNMPDLIGLAARVLAKEDGLSPEEIFDVYRRWLTEKDEISRKQLEAVGIMPMDTSFQH